jgi:curved DNA-binding protein CbpA
MSNKPDYYQILGVTKTTPVEEIKKAYDKIVMRNHPDRLRHKQDMSEADKEKASQLFRDATDAWKVLSDPRLRSTYDTYGHEGLERIKDGSAPSTGYKTTIDITPRRVPTDDEVTDFFAKRTAKHGTDESSSASSGTPADIEADRAKAREERQRRQREEREARRKAEEGGQVYTPPPAQAPSVVTDFREVAEKVGEAAEKLRQTANGSAPIPLDALERFRDNLQDFMTEVDKAIARAKKGPGYRP